MKKAPEKFRNGRYSDYSYGNNGVFVIPHYRIVDYNFYCIISSEEGWEHVSISVKRKTDHHPNRCPTWEEMCFVKGMFWSDDEVVMQLHPAKDNYVNFHPFVLHLWKPIEVPIPTPPKIFV